MARKIKTGDSVIVTTGNSKGSIGIVKSIVKAVNGDRVVIDGVNKRMKHIRRTQQSAGRIEAFFAPIHISNVAHYVDNKPVKVGFRIEDGKKYLINKSTNERIRSIW